MTPEAAERLEVLRRVLERGKRLAEERLPTTIVRDSSYLDLFVHALDELALLKKALGAA